MLEAPLPVMAALIAMPLSARRVKELFVLQETLAATVIFPPNGPLVPVAVVTATSPNASAF